MKGPIIVTQTNITEALAELRRRRARRCARQRGVVR